MALTNTLREAAVAVQTVPLQTGGNLIELAILFIILALVAYVFGARGIAGLSMDIAKWIVIIFIALAIIAFVI
jgi:uncharacterized membrane protein YtjA (UPF0391 family)